MFDPDQRERDEDYDPAQAAKGRSHRIDPEARAAAIKACEMCDKDGYRNGTVCWHVDYSGAARRGMAMLRAAMGWQA